MSEKNTEKIRERVLALIDSQYESDAAFERATGLREKTVNNWRRGRSASFIKILPKIAKLFSVGVGALMDIPVGKDSSELSDDEVALLALYRKSGTLPPKMRAALNETLEATINMYIGAVEIKTRHRKNKDQ